MFEENRGGIHKQSLESTSSRLQVHHKASRLQSLGFYRINEQLLRVDSRVDSKVLI